MASGGESRAEALARLVAANTRPGAGDEERAVHRLILDAATDPARHLTVRELERVLRHIAGAGFDPLALERVRGNLVGLSRPDGSEVQRGERLAPAEAHYLRHVVAQREWPAGTALADYVASLPPLIADPDAGALVGRFQGVWQVTIVRQSRELRGPDGHQWLVVEYRLPRGHWMTAHQLRDGLGQLGRGREDVRWLRTPRLRQD
jgi:hypothetical protein